MKNLIVTVILTASLNYTSCNNTAIFNLAGNIVPSDLLGALGNNLNFCPTHYPSPASLRHEVTVAYLHLERVMLNKDYFHFNPLDTFEEGNWVNDHLGVVRGGETPSWAQVPNPLFNPRMRDGYSETFPDRNDQRFIPSVGLEQYLQETKAALLKRLPLQHPPPVHNLPPEQRDAIAQFKLQRDIVVVTADKNLGCVLDQRCRYERLLRAELDQTHERAEDYFSSRNLPFADTVSQDDVLRHISNVLRLELLPRAANFDLPRWFKKFLDSATRWNARDKVIFAVPLMYLLYKVHKLSTAAIRCITMDVTLDVPTRPVSANFCWSTQPIAAAIAKLLTPYRKRLPEYIQDSTALILLVSTRTFRSASLLLCLDVARLYPAIPHTACIDLVRRHLVKHGCQITDLIIDMLTIVLKVNFCRTDIDDQLWHQTVGFPTGVACGAEVADVYLHELIFDFVAHYFDNYIMLFLRYIDDVFTIWSGAEADFRHRAREFCNYLNTRYAAFNFEVTWVMSDHDAIFLDVRLWLGRQFADTGKLDTATHQKPINRYLYLPFYTAHPQHVLKGFIRGEFKRYLLRSSDLTSYVQILIDFYHRLRQRAYPASFLGPLFKAAPRFEQRQALLFNAKDSTSTPMPFTLKLVYSPSTMALGLQNALRDDGGVLPDHLRDQRRLVVWKRAPRLGDLMKKKKRGDSNDNKTDSTTPPQPLGGIVSTT
jgi:hypothetical protein